MRAIVEESVIVGLIRRRRCQSWHNIWISRLFLLVLRRVQDDISLGLDIVTELLGDPVNLAFNIRLKIFIRNFTTAAGTSQLFWLPWLQWRYQVSLQVIIDVVSCTIQSLGELLGRGTALPLGCHGVECTQELSHVSLCPWRLLFANNDFIIPMCVYG